MPQTESDHQQWLPKGEFLGQLLSEERLALLGTDLEKLSTVPVILMEEGSSEVSNMKKIKKSLGNKPRNIRLS